MLSQKQIQEIREHLEKAQNPVFFFDNDVDGLCSYVLLARKIGRGKGVAIKSFPELNKSYVRKVDELKADYVFIVDKPIVDRDFIESVIGRGLPIVWIDHHDVSVNAEGTYYYNVTKQEVATNEPVTYWCYKISGRKEDLWIGMLGCIADGFLPDFIDEFDKKYPDLWKKNVKSAFEGLYETEIGKVARILDFALKDRTSNVVRMLKYLIKVKSPYEILNDPTSQMMKRFIQVNNKFEKLVEKARRFAKGKVLYFQYAGTLSLSGDIANRLYYEYPNKFIVVAYIRGTKVNISMRGRNAKKITEEAVKEFENASGGGHDMATGATVSVEDLPKFREKIEELVKKYS